MAVSVFPPQRPHRLVRVWGGRTRGAGGSVDLHGGFAAPNACNGVSGGAGRGAGRGGGSRGV